MIQPDREIIYEQEVQKLTAENAELKAQLKGWEANATYSINMGIALATEKLEKENSELKARVKELDNECEAQQYQFDILKQDPACVWANMLRGTIARPTCLVEAHDYQQIKSENAELRAKVEQAESEFRDASGLLDGQNTLYQELSAKCAEMQSVLQQCELWVENWVDKHDLDPEIQHALSPDCGKVILDRVKRLEEAEADNWTGSLIDRLNEFARENRSEFEEIKTGEQASVMIRQIHGRYNSLKSDLKITASNYIRELGAVDKAKEIITGYQEKVKRLEEAVAAAKFSGEEWEKDCRSLAKELRVDTSDDGDGWVNECVDNIIELRSKVCLADGRVQRKVQRLREALQFFSAHTDGHEKEVADQALKETEFV